MKLTLRYGEILQDHTLKAFIEALNAAHGHDRAVLVENCTEVGVVFEILTIQREAELEAKDD